ncbi:MAG: hypothetical protein EBZ47_02220 [Chlamydiae bacterium]|nr:hypothetical protein [Chlamydiota bacterium]
MVHSFPVFGTMRPATLVFKHLGKAKPRQKGVFPPIMRAFESMMLCYQHKHEIFLTKKALKNRSRALLIFLKTFFNK